MDKVLFMAVIVCFITVGVRGQDSTEFHTIFGNVNSSGGYGAPELKFSNVNIKNSLLMGGKGGWIIGHRFVLGGGGYGLVTNNTFPYTENVGGVDSVRDYRIDMGYGGLLLEYIAFPKNAIHFTVPVLIGTGGASLAYKISDEPEYIEDDWTNWQYTESSAFFFIEPGLGLELNMTRFFRLDLGVSYRYISGMNLKRLKEQDFNDFSLNLALKFGKF